MWNCMRNFVTSFCTESSVHGVKYLIKDKNIISRCYWCVMLIFAFYCCGQFSILLSRRFLEIPNRMTIKNGQARTVDLPLPSITFCSENPSEVWHERFLDELEIPPEYPREEVLRAMRLGINNVSPLYVPQLHQLNATLMDTLDHVLMHNKVTTRGFVERASVPCDVLLSRCELRGEILPCGALFKRVNGQCCRFYDNPETFVSAGNTFSNNIKVVTTMNHGPAYLTVHRPLSEPLIEQSSFTMSNDYYMLFYVDPLTVLKSEEVHEMEEETGVCAHPDEQELRFFESYSYYNCVVEWIINASIAVCGCAGTYLPAPDELTCNFTGMNCLRKYPRSLQPLWPLLFGSACEMADEEISKLLEAWDLAQYIQVFKALNKMKYGLPIHDFLGDLAASNGVEFQSCPEACTYTLYKCTFKPRMLVPEYDSTGFLHGVDPKNEYVIHFTYESQFYKIQEFVLIADWITLLSNLGGVYGLFLGCSMMTLAEIVFYLWSRVIRKIWITDHNPPASIEERR